MKKISNPHCYFWVEAYSNVGTAAASKAATSPTDGKLLKEAELVHFSLPWKIRNSTKSMIQRTSAGTATFAVSAAGKVALITGYRLQSDGTYGSNIQIGDGGGHRFIETLAGNPANTIKRNPSYTNGIYLTYGEHIDLNLDTGATGCDIRCFVREFDADAGSAIELERDYVENWDAGHGGPTDRTYSVPASKKLIITWLWAYGGLAQAYLTIKESGSFYTYWDAATEKWDITKGVLEFPAGTELGADTNCAIAFIGILIAE